MDNLSFSTDTRRDILQQSGNFNAPEKAIIEYVKNGYNYKQPKINAVVEVNCSKEKFTISDNGRGMSIEDLQTSFLTMHGENIDRKKGNHTDGFFGSGKCAAFGIGKKLIVKTVKDGLFNHIEINEDEIKNSKDIHNVPVNHVVKNKSVTGDNGTLIEISNLKKHTLEYKESLIRKKIKDTIRYKKDVEIWFQGDVIEIKKPEIDFTRKFETREFEPFKKFNIQNHFLKINVTKAPLEKGDEGIGVYSNTVHHETTLAGMNTNNNYHYIIGEIDLPELDDYEDTPAFLQDRSGLNRQNPLVKTLQSFIGNCIQKIYEELDNIEKEKRDEVDQKRLRQLEKKISDELNRHFKSAIEEQLSKQLFGNTSNTSKIKSKLLKEIFSKGDEISLENNEDGNDKFLTDKKLKSKNKNNKNGNQKESKNEKNAKKINRNRSSSGGFSVEHKDLGEKGPRSQWVRNQNIIFVNTGHSQIKNVIDKLGTDNEFFKYLIYEIACNEFSYAVTKILMDEKKLVTADEALFNYRELLNQLSKTLNNIIPK